MVVFILLWGIGIYIKHRRKKLPNNIKDLNAWILIVIAVLGLIVDGFIVWKSYF